MCPISVMLQGWELNTACGQVMSIPIIILIIGQKTAKPMPGKWGHWQWCLTKPQLGEQQQLPLLLGKGKHQMYDQPGWFTNSTGEQLI